MRNGEMEVHFLPEFDLVSGGVVGAEALLRWQHPERGLLPAAEFIGLAEESGLLVHLGTEVLRRSCELVAGWLRSRSIEDFTLRVNISPRQLAQPTLAPVVEEILEATQLEPSVLCLELAEATLTAEIEESVRQVERLREAGVKISVDDFGTAASSLALLKVLPVDMLKIDMSFVSSVDTDPRDEAIVKAIIDIGRALDLDVVAEGIDSDDQLAVLLELGCRRGQGYGLSKVLRPNELLRRWI
jgi:EAL domain-containing protein (putative c-di-GMP-specific phosphodiesterase class I)